MMILNMCICLFPKYEEQAQGYVDAARSMELLTKGELSRLTLVEFDLEDPETIGEAIGKAATVVCCVGAPESQILDVQAPYRIDGQGTISLIEEGEKMGSVGLFVLVTSLGTGRSFRSAFSPGWSFSI